MEDAFQHEVEFIHEMPALLYLEIFGLWLPIGFHAGLGLLYTFTGKSNVKRYSYGGNARYTLQRVTGILAFVFIFLHIATLRWRWDIFGWYTPFFVTKPRARAWASPRPAPPSVPGGPEGLIAAAVLVVLMYSIGVMSVSLPLVQRPVDRRDHLGHHHHASPSAAGATSVPRCSWRWPLHRPGDLRLAHLRALCGLEMQA